MVRAVATSPAEVVATVEVTAAAEVTATVEVTGGEAPPAPAEAAPAVADPRRAFTVRAADALTLLSSPSWGGGRSVVREVKVQQRSAITMDDNAKGQAFRTALTRDDVRRAFCDARPTDACRASELRAVSEDASSMRLNFDAFCEFLVRVADAKYSDVPAMGLAAKLDGLLDNLTGGRTEEQVVHDTTDIPARRRGSRESTPGRPSPKKSLLGFGW